MYNRSILAGYLTRDPELRYTCKGAAVVGFTIAANRTWTTDSGERKDEATFVECSAWNRAAEVIAQYFRRGHPILVEGDLRNNTWTNDAGEKRSRLYLNVDKFTFLQKKGERPEASVPAVPAQSSPQDEVPF